MLLDKGYAMMSRELVMVDTAVTAVREKVVFCRKRPHRKAPAMLPSGRIAKTQEKESKSCSNFFTIEDTVEFVTPCSTP
jgi:hypothetical protein